VSGQGFHAFRGHRAGKPIKTGGYSQASERHTVHSFDQYGREYAWQAENATGMPVGLVEPQFAAPFTVDPQYFIVNPDNTTEIYVDHVSFIKDRIRSMKEYHAKAVELATKKGWDVPLLGEYSDDIIAAQGRPPRAYQLGVAAEQGNPWALGFTAVPDPRLEQYIESATKELDDVIEHYDFSEKSYQSAVQHGGAPAPVVTAPRPKATKITDMAGLASARARFESVNASAEIDPSAVGESVAEEDDDFAGGSFGAQVEDDFDMGMDEALDSLPDEPSGALLEDPAFEELMDLEEALDSTAAPSRVKPQNVDKATKQGARLPSQTAVPRKRAKATTALGHAPGVAADIKRSAGKAWKPDGKRSLADGAVPAISDG
jgi:hypothetical protein